MALRHKFNNEIIAKLFFGSRHKTISVRGDSSETQTREQPVKTQEKYFSKDNNSERRAGVQVSQGMASRWFGQKLHFVHLSPIMPIY